MQSIKDNVKSINNKKNEMVNIIEEINKQHDLVYRTAKARQALDNLKIVWETDIKKMDFDKLHSSDVVKGLKYLRMDKIKIEPNNSRDDLFEMGDSSTRVLNLIELIESGAKVIPPIFIHSSFIRDGIKVVSNECFQIDGAHRKLIAAYLQLTEIPIVVFERMEGYQFTPGKWSFQQKTIKGECNEATKYIEAKSEEGETINIGLNSKQIYVDTGRFDYLSIFTP